MYETLLFEKQDGSEPVKLALLLKKHEGPGEHGRDSFEGHTSTSFRLLPEAAEQDLLRFLLNPVTAYVASFETEGFVPVEMHDQPETEFTPGPGYACIARSAWSEVDPAVKAEFRIEEMSTPAGVLLHVFGAPEKPDPGADI